MQGIAAQNSPTWTMLFHNCNDVSVDGLNINSHATSCRVSNDDVMDLRDSSNIHISNQRLFVNNDLGHTKRAFESARPGFTASGNLMPKE